MTQIPMDCARFEELLSAWIEDDLDPAAERAMEQHAAGCEACATLATDLRSIRARAAALPSLAPSRDLWAGIGERIAAQVIPIGGRSVGEEHAAGAAAPHARRSRRWALPSLAAAGLVLATAGVTHLAETHGRAAQPTSLAANEPRATTLDPRDTASTSLPSPAAPSPSARTGAPVEVLASAPTPSLAPTAAGEAYRLTGNLAVNTVEASYDHEITRLRTIVDRNRGQLDTSTVRVLEHNLQVIDSAIVQCRRALHHDPGSRFLIESLDNALRSKVELLRTTATMSS